MPFHSHGHCSPTNIQAAPVSEKKESGFGIVMAQKGRKYIKWTQMNPFKNTNELFSKSQHFNNSLEILEVWLMIS